MNEKGTKIRGRSLHPNTHLQTANDVRVMLNRDIFDKYLPKSPKPNRSRYKTNSSRCPVYQSSQHLNRITIAVFSTNPYINILVEN